MPAFYDFPAEHWIRLRTTNPIESTLSTVKLRTKVTRGAGSPAAALAMVFKLVESAQARWRAITGAHLVVDGHSAHRSKKVRDWLAAHPDDVELHFLPPYSPELNPDELAGADLKHSLPKQHRALNQAELAAEARCFFRRHQRQPRIVRSYFSGPHVRYVLDENPMSF